MVKSQNLFFKGYILYQGSDQIDSFWFPNSIKKALIHFDSTLISSFIHFDLRFNLILFILIRFDFDKSRIKIHPRIVIHLRIKNQIESKIIGRWVVIHSSPNHWLIWFRIKSESKWIANHACSSPGLMNFLDKISMQM